MKHTGIFKKHPFSDEEFEVIKFEESDFDYSKEFDALEVNDQANFLSFIDCPVLCETTKTTSIGIVVLFSNENN